MSALEERLAYILAADDLPPFEREYLFDKPRSKRRLDFAWPEYKVGIEVQGGTWSRGAHVRGLGYRRDCRKLNDAQASGWIVIWVTGYFIDNGMASAWAKWALTERGWRDES